MFFFLMRIEGRSLLSILTSAVLGTLFCVMLLAAVSMTGCSYHFIVKPNGYIFKAKFPFLYVWNKV